MQADAGKLADVIRQYDLEVARLQAQIARQDRILQSLRGDVDEVKVEEKGSSSSNSATELLAKREIAYHRQSNDDNKFSASGGRRGSDHDARNRHDDVDVGVAHDLSQADTENLPPNVPDAQYPIENVPYPIHAGVMPSRFSALKLRSSKGSPLEVFTPAGNSTQDLVLQNKEAVGPNIQIEIPPSNFWFHHKALQQHSSVQRALASRSPIETHPANAAATGTTMGVEKFSTLENAMSLDTASVNASSSTKNTVQSSSRAQNIVTKATSSPSKSSKVPQMVIDVAAVIEATGEINKAANRSVDPRAANYRMPETALDVSRVQQLPVQDLDKFKSHSSRFTNVDSAAIPSSKVARCGSQLEFIITIHDRLHIALSNRALSDLQSNNRPYFIVPTLEENQSSLPKADRPPTQNKSPPYSRSNSPNTQERTPSVSSPNTPASDAGRSPPRTVVKSASKSKEIDPAMDSLLAIDTSYNAFCLMSRLYIACFCRGDRQMSANDLYFSHFGFSTSQKRVVVVDERVRNEIQRMCVYLSVQKRAKILEKLKKLTARKAAAESDDVVFVSRGIWKQPRRLGKSFNRPTSRAGCRAKAMTSCASSKTDVFTTVVGAMKQRRLDDNSKKLELQRGILLPFDGIESALNQSVWEITRTYIVEELLYLTHFLVLTQIYNSPPEDFLDGLEAITHILAKVLELPEHAFVWKMLTPKPDSKSPDASAAGEGASSQNKIGTTSSENREDTESNVTFVPLGTDALCESLICCMELAAEESSDFLKILQAILDFITERISEETSKRLGREGFVVSLFQVALGEATQKVQNGMKHSFIRERSESSVITGWTKHVGERHCNNRIPTVPTQARLADGRSD